MPNPNEPLARYDEIRQELLDAIARDEDPDRMEDMIDEIVFCLLLRKKYAEEVWHQVSETTWLNVMAEIKKSLRNWQQLRAGIRAGLIDDDDDDDAPPSEMVLSRQ